MAWKKRSLILNFGTICDECHKKCKYTNHYYFLCRKHFKEMREKENGK